MKDLSQVDFKGRISFCGLSEPYLHKQLLELVQMTKKYCPNAFVDILTNGDYTTVENTKKLFDSGLDNLKISMYDGPEQIDKFKKVQEECRLTNEQFAARPRYLSEEETFGLTINNRGGVVDLKEYNVVPLEQPLERS